MGGVAERFAVGVAAAAERVPVASGDVVGFAVGVDESSGTVDAEGAVVADEDYDFVGFAIWVWDWHKDIVIEDQGVAPPRPSPKEEKGIRGTPPEPPVWAYGPFTCAAGGTNEDERARR